MVLKKMKTYSDPEPDDELPPHAESFFQTPKTIQHSLELGEALAKGLITSLAVLHANIWNHTGKDVSRSYELQTFNKATLFQFRQLQKTLFNERLQIETTKAAAKSNLANLEHQNQQN
jgi:hypothetical protein